MAFNTPVSARRCVPCEEAKKELKDAMERSFSRARFMPDGSLVYPKKGFEPPPDVEGYQRDPGNAWRFIPLWPACRTRARMTLLKKCGATGVMMVCTNQDCPLVQQTLKITDCQGCPFRQE